MIRYLIDSSALWRILREPGVREGWSEVVTSGAVGSCPAQRAEFLRSARSGEDFLEMTEMFADLYPDVGVPKTLWRWVDSAQHRLASAGLHRGPSVIDLAVAGTAAAHGYVVLHDDADMVTLGRHLEDVRECRVRDLPASPPEG